ncbi:hypothetical protein TNCV_3276751 [Trichonephila clavipes]|nr:hypothetical protein TNCV_3276751 [Trichonephila clavipes]
MDKSGKTDLVQEKRSAGIISTMTKQKVFSIFNTPVAACEERSFRNILLVESTSGEENVFFRVLEEVAQQEIIQESM